MCDMDLSDIYAQHPLSARTILARIDRQSARRSALTEWDLAIDHETDITDQNHSGGVQAVLELAQATGVGRESVVVDVGAGLGGPARVLAQVYGCQVVGIDLDEQRCRDASYLTMLARLSDRVTIRHHDGTERDAAIGRIDVLWGQGAWNHFPDPGAFLDSWLPTLVPGGRVAVADSFLGRSPEDSQEASMVEDLERSWGAHLLPVSTWRELLERRQCVVTHLQNRTEESIAAFTRLQRVSAEWPSGDLTDFEREGWARALSCLSRGLVSAHRLVAAKRT